MKNYQLFILSLLAVCYLQGKAQNNFVSLSEANGVPFNTVELDSLNNKADRILAIIETSVPEYEDSFKIYDYHFYLHEKTYYENDQTIIDNAITAAEIQTPYFLIFLKVMSAKDLLEKVYVVFHFPTDSFPCLDASSITSKLQLLANEKLDDLSGANRLSFTINSIVLEQFSVTLAEGFCCSEYINTQNLLNEPHQRSSITCGTINQAHVDDLVDFLQSDTSYNSGLGFLSNVIITLNACNTTEWKPYAAGGIVPYCFWIGSADPLVPYAVDDLPFNVGCIDGLVLGIRNTIEGFIALPEVMNNVTDVVEAYTLYYIRCSGRNVTDQEIAAAWNELQKIEWNSSEFEENFDIIIQYTIAEGGKFWSSGMNVVYGQKDNEQWCSEKEQVRSAIEVFSKSLTSLDSLAVIFGSMVTSINDLWEDVDSVGRFERYYQGYYMMDLTIEVILPIAQALYLNNLVSTVDNISSEAGGQWNFALRERFKSKNARRLIGELANDTDYGRLSELQKSQFQVDFADDYGAVLRISEDNLVNGWKALQEGGHEYLIRHNVDYVDNVLEFSTRSGKNIDEIVAKAKLNENGIEQFFDELEDTPASGHWDLDPFQRGKNIEVDLGQNLPGPFKTIDKYDYNTGEATSIKSIDLDARTYETMSKLKARLNKYAKDLNDFEGYKLGNLEIGNAVNPINSKALEIAIPRSVSGDQLIAVNEVIQSWPSINIVLTVHP